MSEHLDDAQREIARLRAVVLCLTDACASMPDSDPYEHPQVSLLAPDGNLDWSLTLVFLQSVMDGATPCDALDDARTAQETTQDVQVGLQRHPGQPALGQQPPSTTT